jgi:hypothetical protein
MDLLTENSDQLLPGKTGSAVEKPPRTWPAAVFLFCLAACTAEMLTGSTPTLVFLPIR